MRECTYSLVCVCLLVSVCWSAQACVYVFTGVCDRKIKCDKKWAASEYLKVYAYIDYGRQINNDSLYHISYF